MHTSVVHPEKRSCLFSARRGAADARRAAARGAQPQRTASGARVPQTPRAPANGGGAPLSGGAPCDASASAWSWHEGRALLPFAFRLWLLERPPETHAGGEAACETPALVGLGPASARSRHLNLLTACLAVLGSSDKAASECLRCYRRVTLLQSRRCRRPLVFQAWAGSCGRRGTAARCEGTTSCTPLLSLSLSLTQTLTLTLTLTMSFTPLNPHLHHHP